MYLLANDHVFGWLRACAASLRHFSPDLRVIVIPYDVRLRQVRRLCREYRFELWVPSELDLIDRLGVSGAAAPSRTPTLRKLAAFWGPLEHFLVLDVDTVVLAALEPVLDGVREEPDALWFAHCDEFGGAVDEVYVPGPWRTRFLAEYGTHAGNSGIWAAPRGLFSPGEIEALAVEAAPLARHFTYPDQSFLNYCVDRTGRPVRNLHSLGIPTMMWAGVAGCREPAPGRLSEPGGQAVGLVHWAGYEPDAELPYRSIWQHWAGRSVGRQRRWRRAS